MAQDKPNKEQMPGKKDAQQRKDTTAKSSTTGKTSGSGSSWESVTQPKRSGTQPGQTGISGLGNAGREEE